jgi:hypothetical protein
MKRTFTGFFLLLLSGCAGSPTAEGCREFERDKWREADMHAKIRGPLADNLIANCKMLGMNREHIVQMLGKPEKTNYFRDYDLVYVLGPERGFISIDYEWLVFKLGTDGRVAQYRIVTD